MSPTEILQKSHAQGVEIPQQTVFQQAAELGIELDGTELIAMHGLLNRTHPATPEESGKRFDIVRAADRQVHGQRFTERDLTLYGLFHILRPNSSVDD
jgi:hypothetical protein